MLIITQTKLPPYRIPFYVELSKRVSLKVLFAEYENMNEKDLPKKGEIFEMVPKRNFLLLGKKFSWLSVRSRLNSLNPTVVVFELSNYNLNLLYFVIFKFLYSFKIVGWGHGYFRKDKTGSRKLPKLLKKILAIGCDKLIVYTSGGREYLKQIGVNPNKIHIAWNAISYKKDVQLLSIKEKYNAKRLVFLGRLIPEKGVNMACQIVNQLNKKDKNFYLDIIGDGALLQQLKLEHKNNKNITLHGSIINEQELSSILMFGSALICPGYLGLNIVHALAYQLPIISVQDGIDGVYHSPEFEYIKATSSFISLDKLDTESFVKKISTLFSNYNYYVEAANSTQDVLNDISIDRMVNGYLKAVL